MFRALDAHFGKGETYSRQERELIEGKVVPEWLLRGAKLLGGTADGKRCQNAVDALKGLHAAVWKQVQFKKAE